MVYKALAKKTASSAKSTEAVIAVISKDNIRTLRPHTDQEGFKARHAASIVLDQNDFVRIKSESVMLPDEQRRLIETELSKEKEKVSELAASRRKRIEEYERQRIASGKMTDLDTEDTEQKNHILEKAQRQLEEEQDDIKRMNELIFHAKCMTIREAQVAEKQQMKEAEKKESQRLDAVMEAERLRAIERVHERDLKRKQELKEGAKVIRKQIEDRQIAAILEAERKDREIKANLVLIEQQAEKEAQAKLLKMKQQRASWLEIQSANAESVERRKQTVVEACEEDKRIMEYLRQKDEADAERERLEKLKKSAKEKEFARLLALQERLQDKQAEQDALRAKRAMEALERDYRRKEKEQALRKAEQEKMLREERTRQLNDRDHVIAVEALKIKQEFYEMLQRQKTEESKLKAKAEEKHKKSRKYAKEVQEQISLKESARRKSRDNFFKEAAQFQTTQQEQKKHLEQVKERKLQEILELGVPVHYCNDIRRKMKEFEKNKISSQPLQPKASKAGGEGKAKAGAA